MDLRRRKLRLALSIIVIGMLLSFAYHGWQRMIHHHFPDTTFLDPATIRYTDFTDHVGTDDPYFNYGKFPYFPAVLLFFYPFRFLPGYGGMIAFLVLCVAALVGLCGAVFRKLGFSWAMATLLALLFLCNYPVIFCFDRGNIEMLLVFLVGLSLFAFAQGRFTWSFWTLMVPIAFKLYPIVLLLLFVRRRLLFWTYCGVMLFLPICELCLAPFPHFVRNLALLCLQFPCYSERNNIVNHGISADASAWIPVKMLTFFVYSWTHGGTDFIPESVIRTVLSFYGYLGALGLIVSALYVLLVETEFLRRAALLCLYFTVSVAGGGGYKLMYAGMAALLVIFCLTRRRYDFIIVGLLSACLLPKRELFFHFMGESDTFFFDCSIGTVLNPLCLLTAMLLLMMDGLARPIPWRQRWHHLACALWLPDLARWLRFNRAGNQ